MSFLTIENDAFPASETRSVILEVFKFSELGTLVIFALAVREPIMLALF